MNTFRPIDFSTYIDRSCEDVYQSLISMDGWNGCFTTGGHIDLARKEIHFKWVDLGPDKVNAEAIGRNLKFSANEFLSFTWHHDSLPGPTTVRIMLSPKEHGCVVNVTDGPYPKTEKGEFMFMDCSAGWSEFLTLLKVYLETGYRYKNW